MHKQRILILADFFEPGFKAGGPIKTLKEIIRALQADFDFYLITRNHEPGSTEVYPLPTNAWLKQDLYTIMYLSESELRNGNQLSAIKELNPDLIYCNSFFSFHFSIKIIRALHSFRNQIIIAPRGEFAAGALSFKPLQKRLFILFCRLSGLYGNVRFHASSPSEKTDIEKQHMDTGPIHIVADLVSRKTPEARRRRLKNADSLRLCNISRIVPTKNLQRCVELLGKSGLRERVIFDIYGPLEDLEYWQLCLDTIQRYELEDVVKYKGVLKPGDVSNTFSNYDFFFFPTLGENFGHVIIESLSAGTPIILNNTTAWEHFITIETDWSYICDFTDEEKVITILEKAYRMASGEYEILSKNAARAATNFLETQENNKLQMSELFRSVISKTKN
jgi:glycosyltransferase involved in cell wall biosynthesis